jgi:Zn finger protein HypA/HybF involved in hydrogenase expression
MTQSFPPPNFIPTESAIEGIEVYEPAPVKEEEHRETVDFTCPQCGAGTAYSATDSGLTCTHCGYYEPPQKAIVGKGAERFEFTVETMERAAHGWGEARKELQCQNCGAYTSVPSDSLTHTCPFCASNKVIQQEAPQDVKMCCGLAFSSRSKSRPGPAMISPAIGLAAVG